MRIIQDPRICGLGSGDWDPWNPKIGIWGAEIRDPGVWIQGFGIWDAWDSSDPGEVPGETFDRYVSEMGGLRDASGRAWRPF